MYVVKIQVKYSLDDSSHGRFPANVMQNLDFFPSLNISELTFNCMKGNWSIKILMLDYLSQASQRKMC